MITLFGIGDAGKNIVSLFSEHKNYKIFTFSSEKNNDSNHTTLLNNIAEEACEDKCPDLAGMAPLVSDYIQVFLCGSSFSANYTLSILSYFKDKKIDIFYIKPDADLLNGKKKLQENAIFGVLQEYARSGIFNSFYIISNVELEHMIGNVPIKNYFKKLNESIYFIVHYLNFFLHTRPLVGNYTEPSIIQRIKTIGSVDVSTMSEKMLYNLDAERDVSYYLCISHDKLENDGTLHQKIIKQLKQKPKNAFKNISYSIYESSTKEDFGFCIAHTNATQKNKQ